jgi:LDH2 family malate/lactate/ureidoglycolate dehydrogenase
VFNSSTRRIQFLEGRIGIAIQGAEQTTIVFHVPIDGSREMVGVNPIAIGFVVLFAAWIVD